jgi:glutamyl-tRNA reductase
METVDGREPTCRFMDRSNHSLAALGQLHERLSGREPYVNPHSFLLSTCERSEIYSSMTKECSFDPAAVGDATARADVVSGSRIVRLRLAEIAAGVRSRLLGESFIFVQVARAVSQLSAGHPLRPMGMQALEAAKASRTRFEFESAVDYPELTQRMIAKVGMTGVPNIAVIGGGLLARALVRSPWFTDHTRRVVATRSPKRLRRRLGGASEIEIQRLLTPCGLLGRHEWLVIVATSNLAGEYGELVSRVIADARCLAVIDLSSVPLRGNASKPYLSLHDPIADNFFLASNAALAPRLPALSRHLAELLSDWPGQIAPG